MSIITHILPHTTDELVCLGFEVKFDKDADQLDAIYRALSSVPGARVEYMGSKKMRADIKVVPRK